jgi:hypothetical protein
MAPKICAARICEGVARGGIAKQARAFVREGRGVVVWDDATRVADREAGDRAFRGNHREAAGKGVEHLDRKAAFGATRDPRDVALRVRAGARGFAVEPPEVHMRQDSASRCLSSGGGRVGFGRD